MVTLLSLDTSVRHTGYALYEDCKLKEYGVISEDSQKPLNGMLRKLGDLLNDTQPLIVCVENTSVIRNARITRDLTELLGACHFWCSWNDKCYYPMTPTEWRKLVKSKDETLPKDRKSLKEWSLATASSITGQDIKNDNCSDAILIGQAYINLTMKQKGE